MTGPVRLLDVVAEIADDGPFEAVLATTYTYDDDFFVFSGVLPALAGLLSRERGNQLGRRRVSAEAVRDALGNPVVAVLQGYPSLGPSPQWVDRYLWPTRRLGVQHAKCLLVKGRARLHAVVTSANLTEASWCRNVEVAAVWSAPRAAVSAGERSSMQAIVEIAGGLRQLAEAVTAQRMAEEAAAMALPLDQPVAASPAIVWSGKPFDGKPLAGLGTGEEIVVTSPFWPAEVDGCARVVAALRRLAPHVALAGRPAPGSATLEMSTPMAEAARRAACRLEVAVAPDDPDGPLDAVRRLLHGKQISVNSGGAWRSYIGSANATPAGLALKALPNIELGVVADVGRLIAAKPADSTAPPPLAPDPDEPELALGTTAGASPFAAVYAAAHLEATGVLRLHCEPPPAEGAAVAIPSGGVIHPLRNLKEQTLHLDDDTVGLLLRRPEVMLTTALGERLPVPVVVADELKRLPHSSFTAGVDLDLIHEELRQNPLCRPSDDQDDDGQGLEDDTDVAGSQSSKQAVPRKPVHRAREMVEVVTATEPSLRDFLASRPEPPPRLVELRLAGAGSIVDLARHLHGTAGAEVGVPVTAAAFGTIEIERLFERCIEGAPTTVAAAVARITAEVAQLTDDLLRMLDTTTAKRLRTLRREA